MERYILKYLCDSTQDEWRKRFYDYLKMHLDNTLWAYGANMSNNLERTIERQQNYVIPRKGTVKGIYGILQRAFDRKFLKKKRLQKQAVNQSVASDGIQKFEYKVFCAFHLPWLLTDDAIMKMNEVGIGIDFISDSSKPWSKSVLHLMNWYNSIKLLPFNEVIKDQYVNQLKSIYEELLEAFRKTDYDAVMVYTTAVFEEKIFIDIFKELGRVDMELLHGIPGSTLIPEVNRIDYFLVYGDQMRQDAISVGCDANKIYVAGDCKYVDTLPMHSDLRCSLEDVLVITEVSVLNNHYGWDYKDFPRDDRSLIISYIYDVENILKKNGVNHARLRPHPSIKRDWLSRYVDFDFYELDNQELETSLNNATYCIGQYSTVVFEALNQGVSYLVYEPGNGEVTMTGDKLYPPFDGSNPNLKIANTEEQLDAMIKERYCPSPDLGRQYMEPFKPEVIREILEKNRQKNATK